MDISNPVTGFYRGLALFHLLFFNAGERGIVLEKRNGPQYDENRSDADIY